MFWQACYVCCAFGSPSKAADAPQMQSVVGRCRRIETTIGYSFSKRGHYVAYRQQESGKGSSVSQWSLLFPAVAFLLVIPTTRVFSSDGLGTDNGARKYDNSANVFAESLASIGTGPWFLTHPQLFFSRFTSLKLHVRCSV